MTDYADLVKRLKLMTAVEQITGPDRKIIAKVSAIGTEAADAIEKLVRERDEARAERDKANVAWGKIREALSVTSTDKERDLDAKCEAAEAEVARLREALTSIIDFRVSSTWSKPLDAVDVMFQIARAALEAKP